MGDVLVDLGGNRATIEVGLKYENKPMPRLALTPLQLTQTEREQLQQVVNRHSTPSANCLKSQHHSARRRRTQSPLKSLVNLTLVEIWQDCGATGG